MGIEEEEEELGYAIGIEEEEEELRYAKGMEEEEDEEEELAEDMAVEELEAG